jgi:phage FluMu protein Com
MEHLSEMVSRETCPGQKEGFMGQDAYCKKCGKFLYRAVPMDNKNPNGAKGVVGPNNVKQEDDGPYFICPDPKCKALNKMSISTK